MATISHSDLETLWTLAGGSQATADTAAAIAQAESGGNPAAILNTAFPNLPGYHPPAKGNLPEYSVGLWQVNLVAHPQYTAAAMLTPRLNAIAAVAISNGGLSFSAWSTYKSGAYKDYLISAGTPGPQAGVTTGLTADTAAPHMHSGWADLRNSMNRHLPRQLVKSDTAVRAAYRTLAQRGKRGHAHA